MDKGTPKPAEVVEGIVADLTDRRGLRHEWDNIDEDVIEELKNTWAAIVQSNLGGPETGASKRPSPISPDSDRIRNAGRGNIRE